MRLSYAVLKMDLDLAVEDNLLASNPCKGVNPPTAEASKVRPFTDQEVQAILEASENSRYRPLWVLLFDTGMRPGPCPHVG